MPEWPNPHSWEHGIWYWPTLGGLEPDVDHAAGNRVLPQPHVGNIEAVNHVLRGESSRTTLFTGT